MTNQYRRDTINKASSKDASARDTSARDTRVIGRRQLLSTFALGSTALVGMVSLKNGAGVTGNGVGGTGVHDTSVHDALFSPAAAQETTFTLFTGASFRVDSNGRINTYIESTRGITASIYWQAGSTSGLFYRASAGTSYFVDGGDETITRINIDANPPISDYLPNQIRPRTITSGGATLTVYPVTGRTGAQGLTDPRVLVGYYAKHSAYDSWQFIPRRPGNPAELNLEVLVAVDGTDGTEVVVPFSIGHASASINANTITRTIPASGFLADDTRTGAMSRQTFDAALDALEFGTDEIAAGDSNPLRLVLGLPTTTTTTTTTEATVTEATVTVAPGPTTSTMEPTESTTAPTTSTNVATTANATIAPTTTLVSTTVGAATMAPTTTLVSTTMAGTTLVSPTLAGELSVRGAINAQGNIGANVARSLSGRLSSFRTRNRPRR